MWLVQILTWGSIIFGALGANSVSSYQVIDAPVPAATIGNDLQEHVAVVKPKLALVVKMDETKGGSLQHVGDSEVDIREDLMRSLLDTGELKDVNSHGLTSDEVREKKRLDSKHDELWGLLESMLARRNQLEGEVKGSRSNDHGSDENIIADYQDQVDYIEEDGEEGSLEIGEKEGMKRVNLRNIDDSKQISELEESGEVVSSIEKIPVSLDKLVSPATAKRLGFLEPSQQVEEDFDSGQQVVSHEVDIVDPKDFGNVDKYDVNVKFTKFLADKMADLYGLEAKSRKIKRHLDVEDPKNYLENTQRYKRVGVIDRPEKLRTKTNHISRKKHTKKQTGKKKHSKNGGQAKRKNLGKSKHYYIELSSVEHNQIPNKKNLKELKKKDGNVYQGLLRKVDKRQTLHKSPKGNQRNAVKKEMSFFETKVSSVEEESPECITPSIRKVRSTRSRYDSNKYRRSSRDYYDSDEYEDSSYEAEPPKSPRAMPFDWHDFNKFMRSSKDYDYRISELLKKYYEDNKEDRPPVESPKDCSPEEVNFPSEPPAAKEKVTIPPVEVPASGYGFNLDKIANEFNKAVENLNSVPVGPPLDKQPSIEAIETENNENKSEKPMVLKRKNGFRLPLRLVQDEDGKCSLQLDMKFLCRKCTKQRQKWKQKQAQKSSSERQS